MDEKTKVELHPQIVYQPKKGKENQLSRFRKFVESRYGVKLDDYWELYEWSRKNYREFWECVWIFFNIISSRPYIEVFDKNGSFESTDWFTGAKLNFAENVLRHRSSKIALIATDDHDNEKYISYEQLYMEVSVYVEALRALGVQKGDVVSCYMSHKLEAAYAYFATASIGALWCGALPFLGAKAVVLMFKQTNPKVLFTGGNPCVDGGETEMVLNIAKIIKSLPSLRKVILIPPTHGAVDVKDLPLCVDIEEFLKPAREKISKFGANIIFEQVPFNSPLCINFTSGTTGPPKALIHSHGSLLAPLKDFGLCLDCTNEDILLSYTPVGWISWNFHISTLYFGLSVVIYDGNVFEGSPTRLWDIVDKFGITVTTIKCKNAENMEQKKYIPTEKHSLKTLKAVFPGGTVCKSRIYEFFTDIKPGLFCSSMYGATEYFGMLAGMDSNLPVYKGEIQCFSLGYDLRTVDTKGNFIVGQRGDMVQLNPAPTTPVSSLGGDSKSKLKEIYLTKYPGAWDTGDDVWINPVTNGFIVYGRSDDVMKPKHLRFNCADVYFALEGFPSIVDTVCVSKVNSKLDERVLLFVKMAAGQLLTAEIEDKIRKTIKDNLSNEQVPDLILEVPGIPYNMNGKKCNSLVKKLVNKSADPNTENVMNPSTIDFFKNLDLGDF